MKYKKEDIIVKEHIKKIKSNMAGFFKLIIFFTPKWFQFLNYLIIISIFLYISKLTDSNLLYIITIISISLIATSILGFIDTINYLTFKPNIVKQLIMFILLILPLFYLSTFMIVIITNFLTSQFG